MNNRDNWPNWTVKHFPTNPSEAMSWEPIVRCYALHTEVLVVATTRIEGAWCAYCSNVPGMDHRLEMDGVLNYGCLVGEHIANQMFPEFVGIPYSN